MSNIEGLMAVPDRPGWFFGTLNWLTNPDTGQQSNLALVHESGRTLVLEMPGRVAFADAVVPAQEKITEWESMS